MVSDQLGRDVNLLFFIYFTEQPLKEDTFRVHKYGIQRTLAINDIILFYDQLLS